MKTLTKQDLEKLIFEEINKMAPSPPEIIKEEAVEESDDPTQQYVDWIVAISEAAQEAIQKVEGGTEPYLAAHESRLSTLAQDLRNSDFWHHFHG
jgi:hypothetical protein